MNKIKLRWNKDKIDKIIQIIDNYITINNAHSGEVIQQCDRCIENAIELAADLADLFEEDKYWKDN